VTCHKKIPDHISNSLTFPGLQNSLTIPGFPGFCGNPDTSGSQQVSIHFTKRTPAARATITIITTTISILATIFQPVFVLHVFWERTSKNNWLRIGTDWTPFLSSNQQ